MSVRSRFVSAFRSALNFIQDDESPRGRAIALVQAAGFFAAGIVLIASGADRSWLHVAASGFFWSLGWVASGSWRFAFSIALVPSLVWELVQQPLMRGAWSVDAGQIGADVFGMCLAFVVLSGIQRSPIGWRTVKLGPTHGDTPGDGPPVLR